jgi:hypothetical protein
MKLNEQLGRMKGLMNLTEETGTLYYHGRKPGRPYQGTQIYITDNMGYAIGYSDMKQLYCYKLKFPEDQVFRISNPKHRQILAQAVDQQTFKAVMAQSTEGAVDWAAFSTLVWNDDHETAEDLLESLGFKGAELRERPGTHSLVIFNEQDLQLVKMIDLTTPEMLKFAQQYFENPGYNAV